MKGYDWGMPIHREPRVKRVPLIAFLLVASGLIFPPILSAQSPPPKQQSETEVLTAKLKAAELAVVLAELKASVSEEQLALQRVEQVRTKQREKYSEACKLKGLDPDPKLCAIDLDAGTVTKRAPATPPAK